jgi:type I restriction enzyme, S subunit
MSKLPNHWATANLLHLADLHRGVTYTKADARETPTDGVIPVLRANNIQDRSFDLRDLVYVPAGLVSELQRIQKGDVVVATSSGSISVVGKAAQAEADMNAGFGAFCGLLRPTDLIDARYFGHFFSTEAYRTAVSSLARGVNINNLKRDHFSSLHIPIAPLPEQTRIADKLDAVLARVDACRDRLDRVPGILKRFRQAVLAAATSGKLTEDWRADQVARMQPQAESGNVARDAAELHYHVTPTPDSATLHPGDKWTVTTLGKCGTVSGGLTKNGNRNLLSLRKPYLRVANVYANRLLLNDVADIGLTEAEHTKTRLVSGDLLIVEGNGSLEQLGRVALWQGELEDCVHQNHLIRWRTTSPLAKFVLFWLMSPLGRNDLMELASTTTGLHTLSISKVSALPIKLPSLAEQTEIVRQVETLFAYADRLEARYQTARAQVEKLTPALLAKAFRGELVPQDPNDDPAAILLERLKANSGAPSAKPRRSQRSVPKQN